MPSSRSILGLAGALALAACATSPQPAVATPVLDCRGVYQSGGYAVCQSHANAVIWLGGQRLQANADGAFVIGFDRDTHGPQILRVDGSNHSLTLDVTQRTYAIQRIDGLPQQQVSPSDPVVLTRIARDQARKTQAFQSTADTTGFLQTMIWPVQGRISAAFGGQRILNGDAKRPHYGVDIAAPAGTPVAAPADGVVTLAAADLHYEGGLVLIDHGQGLTTAYLHLSRLDVKTGQQVTQGQVLGAVGATGRATGPHLCWRMRWRDQHMDPSLWTPHHKDAP